MKVEAAIILQDPCTRNEESIHLPGNSFECLCHLTVAKAPNGRGLLDEIKHAVQEGTRPVHRLCNGLLWIGGPFWGCLGQHWRHYATAAIDGASPHKYARKEGLCKTN
mmetsp:Transcript_91965/g.173246  ORF Transcript_91965/g.173246 Transcript_91965/m.173246 type:complete len:108 (+) Transcript_91965:1697-2020(+)